MNRDIEMMPRFRGLVGFVHGFQIGNISEDRPNKEWVVEPDDPSVPSVRVNARFMEAYKPEIGGFYVVSDVSGVAFYYPAPLFNRTFQDLSKHPGPNPVADLLQHETHNECEKEKQALINQANTLKSLKDERDQYARKLNAAQNSLDKVMDLGKDFGWDNRIFSLNQVLGHVRFLQKDRATLLKQCADLRMELAIRKQYKAELQGGEGPSSDPGEDEAIKKDPALDEVCWRREVLNLLQKLDRPQFIGLPTYPIPPIER